MRPPSAVVLLVALSLGRAYAEPLDTATGWFDLPIRDGWRTLAAYGVAREERALALTLIGRQLSGPGRSITPPERMSRGDDDDPPELPAVSQMARPSFTVPAPLSDAAWRSLLDLGPRDDLFDAMLRDRSALLLCLGLTATDASVRTLLLKDGDLLQVIRRATPGTFAATARSLRIDAGSMALPGGADAAALWRSLVSESPAEPAAFIPALLARDRGRLALFYDTMASLAPDRVAHILGASVGTRLDRARALYESFRSADTNWALEDHPFVRPIADPWSIVALVDAGATGIAGPSWSRLWRALFADEEVSARDWSQGSTIQHAPMSLAEVTRDVAAATARERRDRFEMVRLAQRVFPNATDADALSIATAIGGYRRYRALLLTLERLGVDSPRVWANAVRAARHVDEQPGEERRIALSCFQGALVLVERARIARVIDAPTAAMVIDRLSTDVQHDERVSRSVAAWIVATLMPALPPIHVPDRWTGVTAYESRVLQAMAGPRATAPMTVTWEGLEYNVDLQAAELERLTRIRTTLASPGLDRALASGDAHALADALVALAYTPALGDPDGVVMVARDVPGRHDFGYDAISPERRRILPWSIAREDQRDGVPWHLQGSLLGLDLGLARLALRRVADQQMPSAPTLNLNDLLTLARTVVALNPHDLTDDDRDAIVDALDRGRNRLVDALGHADRLQALAIEARMSAARRELLPWMTTHDPAAVALQFSLRDLLWLGRPLLTADRLDRWGVHGRALDGRLTTVMPRAAAWEDYAGRADVGLMATQAPDLILRLAEETRRLNLPAAIVPALLGFAVQDYWHGVEARFADDWPALTRAARELSPARVEDYVAALTGHGPLRSQ